MNDHLRAHDENRVLIEGVAGVALISDGPQVLAAVYHSPLSSSALGGGAP